MCCTTRRAPQGIHISGTRKFAPPKLSLNKTTFYIAFSPYALASGNTAHDLYAIAMFNIIKQLMNAVITTP